VFRPPPLPRNLEAAVRDAIDPQPRVRIDAIRDLLAHAGDHRSRVIATLEKAVTDREPKVRGAALAALGELGASEVLPAILIACEDEDGGVRQEAIAALGEVGDERARGKLERALVDPRPEVRFQAVMAFPRVCSVREDVVAALVRATRDDDEHVIHVALRMSEAIGAGRTARDLGAPPDEDEPIDEGLDDGLDEEPPTDVVPAPLLERARALVAHASPRVRAVAGIIVLRAGDDAGREVVLGVVDGSIATPEAEDIAAAIELAGRRRLTAATRALERRAFGGVLGFGRDA
jgi:hypothetical protein